MLSDVAGQVGRVAVVEFNQGPAPPGLEQYIIAEITESFHVRVICRTIDGGSYEAATTPTNATEIHTPTAWEVTIPRGEWLYGKLLRQRIVCRVIVFQIAGYDCLDAVHRRRLHLKSF